MRFRSTRHDPERISFSQAVSAGLAGDGGLWVPEFVPKVHLTEPRDLATVARDVLAPFLENDDLEPRLSEIVSRTFDIPAPLVRLNASTEMLELFHGPTAAFKDFGARFLAACLESPRPSKIRTVLVATSGDTGSAVADAFWHRPGFRVVILFPIGKVSEFQRRQLTGYDDNVLALAVRGTFDDCQRLVKGALHSTPELGLLSANSISVGRWVPQAAYFAWASHDYWMRTGNAPGLVVPSGNLGNGVAACLAMEMGFPIREVVLSFNENRAVADFFDTGTYQTKPTIQTIANAMDVGAPSNFDRLRWLYPSLEELKRRVRAVSIRTDAIRTEITRTWQESRYVACPHTAVGLAARRSFAGDFIVAATAHPAKFADVIEPILGEPITTPAPLIEAGARPSMQLEIEANADALDRVLRWSGSWISFVTNSYL